MNFLVELAINNYAPLIVHGVLILGIAGYFASKFAGIYKFIAMPVSVAMIVGAIFFEGNLYALQKYNKEVAEYQEKIKVAEEQSKKTNTVIQTKVVEKVKIVKEKTDANVQYVEKVLVKYDNMCVLPNATISLHNSASQNEVSRSTGSPDERPSDVKASDLIRTVTENYGTYYQMREQLLGWQQWYKEQRKIYEGIK